MLEIGRVVAGVVEPGGPAPAGHNPRAGPGHGERVVEVVHDQRVVARAARDVRHLEDVLEILHRRPRGPAVARVGQLAGGRLAHLERLGARAVQERADNQRVLEEPDVEVEGLDQGVDVPTARHAVVEERIQPEPARHRVAALAAVENIVEGRPDQHIVARRPHDGLAVVVAHQGQGQAIGGHRRGVEHIVPTLALDGQRVALAPHRIHHIHVDRARPVPLRRRVRPGRTVAKREGVAVRGPVDDHLVRRAVPQIEGHLRQARALERVDRERVRPAASQHRDPLNLTCIHRTAPQHQHAVRSRAAQRDRVGIRPRRQLEQVAVRLTALAAANLGQEQLTESNPDDVVARPAVDVIQAAPAVDLVHPVPALHQVAGRIGAAVNRVVPRPAHQPGAPQAVVHDVVGARPAVDHHRPLHAAVTKRAQGSRVCPGHHVVVAVPTVELRRPAPIVDEHIVARIPVQLDVRGHPAAHIDVIAAVPAVGDDLLHPAIDLLPAAELHQHGLPVGVAAQVFDEIKLVGGALANAPDAVATARVEGEHSLGGHRIPGPRVARAVRIPRQIHHPRQFDIPDGEAHRNRHAEEQELDLRLGPQNQRHPPGTRRRDAGPNAHSGEGDPERAQLGGSGEAHDEEVLGDPRGLPGHLAFPEGHAEIEAALEAEAVGPQGQPAAQRDVEVALVVEHAIGV